MVDHTNLVDQIMAFEQGDLSDEDTIELFQYLVDTGDAWKLQGSYGRRAMHLINLGLVQDHTDCDSSCTIHGVTSTNQWMGFGK